MPGSSHVRSQGLKSGAVEPRRPIDRPMICRSPARHPTAMEPPQCQISDGRRQHRRAVGIGERNRRSKITCVQPGDDAGGRAEDLPGNYARDGHRTNRGRKMMDGTTYARAGASGAGAIKAQRNGTVRKIAGPDDVLVQATRYGIVKMCGSWRNPPCRERRHVPDHERRSKRQHGGDSDDADVDQPRRKREQPHLALRRYGEGRRNLPSLDSW